MFSGFNYRRQAREYNDLVALDRNTFADVFVPRNHVGQPEAPVDSKNAVGRIRRAGFLLFVSGMLLLTISAGDTLADAAQRGFRGDELRGSVSGSGLGKVIHGTGGVDILHGPSRGGKIVGGSGADEVYGGPGSDVLLGGSGDDFIEAKDGVGDFVGCGAGHDVASIDEKDLVAPRLRGRIPGLKSFARGYRISAWRCGY